MTALLRHLLLPFAIGVAALWALPPTAAAYTSQLRRYPYLTDVVGSNATINWATDRSSTGGTAKWGKVGTESCTAHSKTASRSSITVNGVAEYQWKASLSLSPDTAYCYRVYLGPSTARVDLLATDPSPQFVTQLPAGSASPFKFAVFGDWGKTTSTGNPDQANLIQQIASSGARFAISTGDNAYPSGTQKAYGDLVQTGNDVSAVFGPNFWTVAGKSTPLFATLGNHDLTSSPGTILSVWPSDTAAASSGGRYAMDSYCCLNGTKSRSYPSVWYAFDAGAARFYILDASWAEDNVGSASLYQDDYDYHWTPGSAQYQWLERDLATHPTQVKFASFHFPLYADHPNERSDPYLQGSSSLEGLLSRYGVDIAFSGHAHIYQRNLKAGDSGLVSYTTGGGGAVPGPVSGCTTVDAYAIGWSSSSLTGSACGAASPPTSPDRVFHFLLVSVDGSHVTVTPTDELGRTFDVQSYDFPADSPPTDTTPPTTPTGATATALSPTRVDLSWKASSDNIGVTGYEVFRDGASIGTVAGSATTYSDTNVSAGTTYAYTVRALDAAGNASAPSDPATVTTPTEPPPPPLAFVRDATGSVLSGRSFDVPISSTTGDALTAAVAVQAGTTTSVSSVQDSAGNAWVKGPVGFWSGFNTRIELWYSLDTAPVSKVTVTLSATDAASANVSEFHGVAGVSPLDASAGAGHASSTTASTPPITTANASDLLVAAVNYPGAALSALATPGFTALSDFSVSTVNGRAAYRIASAADTYSAAWTLSGSASSGGAILALKGA